MAFTCGFYNSVGHDRKYDAVQHGQVFDGIITDGIYATYLKAMVVKASENANEVIVQPGRAWFNHTWSYNDADYPVTAPDPEVVLDRIDTLVLDINSEDAVRDNQFLWVQGTPTSQTPEPPALIRTATHNQYPLCDVYRKAGTTQIYAADITNRVGTSDCPFVTGVLEGINIDDLLAQWDDEFHTWENATKASFEGWMINQQAVYSAWWDALKTQMAGDVADVEEWVQTIKDIIDEETATHLQLEIDEINSMLPSGSHITVTTADTELYSRPVTITDEDDNTVTSQFDATGVAVFKSVPYVGNLTIEATDGIRTATAVVNTPYFARYEFPLAFWSATVNITGGTELGGETVTITDSSQVLVGTVVLNASGTGVFNATYPDTYKFSVTHGGQTMEVSLAVTQETTYNVTIHAGFNWRGWVDTAKYLDSTDYDSLDEVLADELAVRELCLEHACVDYMAEATSTNEELETVINNDLFAKWVNNSDYALDFLGANAVIKALMDEADKYFYGEWVITDNTTTPPTWGAKGNVPVMTANDAPYGTVGLVNTTPYNPSNNPAFKAFDDNDETMYSSNTVTSGGYAIVYYKFTNPVCPHKFDAFSYSGTPHINQYKIVGSNDGSTWIDLTTAFNEDLNSHKQHNIDTDNYYLYLGIYVTGVSDGYTIANAGFYLSSLQFYGRELSVSVPVMTGNTTPYGEAIYSTAQSGSFTNYSIVSYGAVDSNSGTAWACFSNDTDRWCGYDFGKKVTIKAMYQKGVTVGGTNYLVTSYKIQGSDTGNANDWHDVTDAISVSGDNSFTPISGNDEYRYWRMYCISGGYQNVIGIVELQFYGLDYSEKEFEEGTTKKWLYDHGLELETITPIYPANAKKTIEGLDFNIVSNPGANVCSGFVTDSFDLTNYTVARAKLGNKMIFDTGGGRCGQIMVATNLSEATKAWGNYTLLGNFNMTPSYVPYNSGFDISSINQSAQLFIGDQNGQGGPMRFIATEWWLE